MSDPLPVTMQLCERCGGDGKLYTSRYGGNDPDVWPIGDCPECEGTAYVLIETEEVDEEEMAAMDEEMAKALQADGEMLRSLTGEDHGPYFIADCLTCNGAGKYWNGLLQEFRPCVDCTEQAK